jgi:hypothetical protein
MEKDKKPGSESGNVEFLPSRQTFLLRFSDATQPQAGIFHGRVEHIDTGKTTRFNSFPEVIEFASEIMEEESHDKRKNR